MVQLIGYPGHNCWMEAVTVQFYKHPRTPHWGFSGHLIGEDRHGHWVGLPRGSRRWKGSTERSPTGEDAVQCFPHDGWWALHFNGPTRSVAAFIDITTQPVVDGGRIEMVDLDLDVLLHADGSVEVVDQDEFEQHQVALGYPRDMIDRAAEETERVAGWLRRRTEPFFEVAEGWLEYLANRSSPTQG